jgi:hypothetical protein
MATIKCKNSECTKGFFIAKRKDQLFCSVVCRNQYNNLGYKFKMEPYKQIAEQLYQQDFILNKLIRDGKFAALNYADFGFYGIELQNARQLKYEQEKLNKATFVNFTITHYKDNVYKLERL